MMTLSDEEGMRQALEAELSRRTPHVIHVTGCSAKPSRSRQSVRGGRRSVVYELELTVDGAKREPLVLLGIAPTTSKEFGAGLADRARALGAHPWAAPFSELVLHMKTLPLTLLVFPLDPAMPGLAELTGQDGARVLAQLLPECRAGAELVHLEVELAHYKPLDRAVLRVGVRLALPQGAERQRTLYAKFFADDHGERCFNELAALWAATRGARWLRMPEPLAYDPARRMLLLSEAPGQRDLTEWVKCLENGEPLPPGVDGERLGRCARVAAGALAELQRSGLRAETRRTFAFEFEQVQKDRERLLPELRVGQPELAAVVESLLIRLERLAPADEELVPAHGGYRHKQMIGDEATLTLIDWDGISMASPALDPATFLARILREPRRNPGAAPELLRMGATFREAFLADRPGLERELDLYEALVLAEQVLRTFRRNGGEHETEREVRLLAAAANEFLDGLEG
jgi:hypothetical protein